MWDILLSQIQISIQIQILKVFMWNTKPFAANDDRVKKIILEEQSTFSPV